MENRRCVECGKLYRPRSQVPNQFYCSAAPCQRERRRRWQSAKRKSDPDYRDNQLRAQRAWQERNPDYWREYRRQNPEYSERNRVQQRKRNETNLENAIAKIDASTPIFPFPSGIYEISHASHASIAKMDSWMVKITLLPRNYDEPAENCKERTR